MKTLNIVLTPVAALGVATFVAYFGLQTNFGLVAILPDAAKAFLIDNGWLQFVAIGVAAAALLTKLFIGQALKRQREENRV